jgi:hypothetical protein
MTTTSETVGTIETQSNGCASNATSGSNAAIDISKPLKRGSKPWIAMGISRSAYYRKRSKEIQKWGKPQARQAGPAKMGRPPSLTNDPRTLRQLRELAAIQCTVRDAAGVLGVCEETLAAFIGIHGSKLGREAWDNGRATGRMSILRKQYSAAMAGNTTLLIWWGKQHLGQSDRLESKVQNTVDATISATASVALVAPAFDKMDDDTRALREFEAIRHAAALCDARGALR